MTTITALVAEDEAPQRAELLRMLKELSSDIRVVAQCEDGLSALEAIEAHAPQVAFLDIRMPGVSGLEVARSLTGRAHVVFTTAYDEYAIEAFDQGAVDYLLKPIKRDRLAVAIDRIRERLKSGSMPELSQVIAALESRLATRKSTTGIKWITATIGTTTKMFPVDEVLFFQAQDKYTRVVTLNDEAIIRTPLKELLDGLDVDHFWQIHRSVIVRIKAIQSVQRSEEGRLILRIRGRDDLLPVSSAFQYRFKAM